MATPNLGLTLQALHDRGWHTLNNQNFQRLEDRLSTQFAGNPNGNVAGFWIGQLCYDTTNGKFYRCTTATGVAGTSVWQTLENSLGFGALASLNTVGAAQIDANAVTTAKILNGNVTGVKLNGGSDTPGNLKFYGTNAAGAFGFYDSGPLTKSFVSTAQAITSGGALTVAHGLGAVPKLVTFDLVCVTGEQGFNAGDVYKNPGHDFVNSRGLQIVADATNLNGRFGSNASAFNANNFGTGTGSINLTNANWSVILRAYA